MTTYATQARPPVHGRERPGLRLETPRLALREFDGDDLHDVITLHRDPRVRERLLDDFPLDQDAVAREFLQRMTGFYRAHEGFGIWHASRLEGDAPQAIGWFSLMPVGGEADAGDLGSRLLPSAWGGGLCTEGCTALLAHAFDTLGLRLVRASCHPLQRSARAALLSLGFTAGPLATYCGHEAATHSLDRAAWAQACGRPLRQRQREATRALGRASAIHRAAVANAAMHSARHAATHRAAEPT